MSFSIFMTILGPSIGFMITSMDPLLLSLNLTEITEELAIPPDLVGFTGSAATLVVAAAVLGVGNLGDVYGLKRMLIYGFMGSIVFQVLAAFSPSYLFLIAMRFLDGLALTALVGLSLALVKVSVPEQVLPVALGFYAAVPAVFYGLLGQFGTVVLGFSAAAIGLFYLPGTLVFVAASILAGYLIPKFTARRVLVCGLLVSTASGVVMSTSASPTMAVWVLALATFLGSLGVSIASPSISSIILSHAPPERAGAVAAMRPAFGKIGYSLGPTIYILLLNVFFHREWFSDAQARGLTDAQAQQALNVAKHAAVGDAPSVAPYDPSLVEQALEVARADYTSGLRITMLIAAVLVPLVVAALSSFLIPREPRPTSSTS